MEDWNANGQYSVAILADRAVPVPRDPDKPFSLYAMCRAWVRNNPSVPLVVGGADASDAAAALGGASASQGLLEQPQLQTHGQGSQPQGLLSSLPPLLPPTALETDTSPPALPLDAELSLQPEEAMRRYKEHWVAVRQYHQAVRRAKLSRCRERLQVLLGEPSALQSPLHPQPGAAPQGQQQLHQSLLAVAAQSGMVGLQHVPFQGGMLAPGGLGAPLSGEVSDASAQAALAAMIGLTQGAGDPSKALALPPQPQPHEQPTPGQPQLQEAQQEAEQQPQQQAQGQQQQQHQNQNQQQEHPGAGEGGLSVLQGQAQAQAMLQLEALPPEVLLALQQHVAGLPQQQGTGHDAAAQEQGMLGQLSAAMSAAAAAAAACQEPAGGTRGGLGDGLGAGGQDPMPLAQDKMDIDEGPGS